MSALNFHLSLFDYNQTEEICVVRKGRFNISYESAHFHLFADASRDSNFPTSDYNRSFR